MSGHYFDRARSLPVNRVQLGEMVEHLGIAPSIPVWKTGVYLSTPMLEKKEPENTVCSLVLLSDLPRPAGRSLPTFPRNSAEAAIA